MRQRLYLIFRFQTDASRESAHGTSKVLLNISSDFAFGIDHKAVIKNEIQKEIQYMKDLVLGKIYDSDTKALNFSHANPEYFDDIFFNALRDMLANDEIKVKHILLTSNDEHLINEEQLGQFLDTFANFTTKSRIHKTLDFTGNQKLTSQCAVNLGKLIKWRKNVDLRSISQNNLQVLVIDGLAMKKPESLQILMGKHLANSKWINYLSELSMSGCQLNDSHLLTLSEDSLQFFNSAPLLKSLDLSYNNLSLHSCHWLAKGMLRFSEVAKTKSNFDKLFLSSLNLYGNNLTNKGLKLLLTALAV